MNVLFITPSFPKEEMGQNIYTDIAEGIAIKNKITVVVAEEKKKNEKTTLVKERNIPVLRVRVGNLYDVSFIEKGLTFITMQYKIKNAIRKYLKNENYDMILFMAPPITLGSVVKYAMKKYKAISYLMQKDIFPQNAIDLKIMTKKSPVYWYFRYKEKNMYKIATFIGCMSKKNMEFLEKHNKFLDKNKLELFPNTITCRKGKKERNSALRRKYDIADDAVLAIYGGNFGKPQGINFIEKVLQEYKNNSKVVFLFIGKGTEKEKLYNFIKDTNIKNAIALDFVPRDEYLEILSSADIGLVFLDYRFTIPNIPSRTLSYFEYELPIMAATDKNTDYRNLLEDAKAGLWSESNNIDNYKREFDKLIADKKLREKMGQNGRKYLEENLTTDKSIEILEKHIKERGN